MESHIIRPEVQTDLPHISSLHDRAFGDYKTSELVDALRLAAAALEPLSFVAEEGGNVVGHVMLSAARLDAPPRLVDVYVLSPLGVAPEVQRQGIGTALVKHALEAANSRKAPLVFLEGDPRVYAKMGLKRASQLQFRSPSLRIPDPAFQVALLDTYQPWMTGSLVYSETFWALDCVGLR